MSLRHVLPVVDRSVSRSCGSESRGKHVSNFPHRGDGIISRSLRHVHTVVDQSIVCSCASVSQGKNVSNFHIGVMGNFEHEHAHS